MAIGTALLVSGMSGGAKRPKVPDSQLSRLNVSMDVGAPRKAVMGTTAFPLDLRYHEGTGTDQAYIHYIVAHAAHEVASIDEIWFEQDQAWTSGGGVTAKYSGYLTVTTRTEGASGNEVTISGNWGTGERLTGCAYTYIKIKRTGNTDTSESPLVSGLPSRVTVIGQGALLYDPRLDSTVTGGSGAHRADDQTTWGASYSPADSYDNPALQALWWLLGWKIGGKLSIGCGVPPARIDLESFIEAANICDESIALGGGGTQERYRSSGTASDADNRMAVIETLLTACNGTLRDTGGKLSLVVIKNDLADYVLDFDDNDLLGEFNWQQTRGLSDSYNVVRGRFVDPSNNSLYQMVDYPEVSITSPDGIERVLSLDLAYVEEGRRAQRIAKQVLQRNQYRGTFTATFTAKALGVDVGEVVRLSFETLGWTNKLFRVITKQISMNGQVPLTLLEENAAIYAWDAEESAVVTATAPTVYDALNSPFILSATATRLIADGKVNTYLDANEPYPIDLLVGDPLVDSPSLSLSFTGSFAEGDIWFTPVTKLVSRWDSVEAAWDTSLADITKTISGASNVALNYDSAGVITTVVPKSSVYKIAPAGSAALTAGVTWAVSTKLGGTQVESDVWSGTAPSISGTGTGALSINSGLKISEATLEITATIGGVTYPAYIMTVSKVLALAVAAPADNTFSSVSVTGQTINSSTFAQIAALTVTTLAASTDVDLTANALSVEPTSFTTSVSSSNIQLKWQWDSTGGGVWTDVGTADDSDPDPFNFSEGGGFYDPVAGTVTSVENKAGLTASTAYDFRLMARISSGSTSATFQFVGTVSAQG